MQAVRRSVQCVMALAALTLWMSFAADIDGKWTAQVEGRNGTRTQTLMLKASGNTLTGTLEGGRGRAAEISNGVIDGDNVFLQRGPGFSGQPNDAAIQRNGFR